MVAGEEVLRSHVGVAGVNLPATELEEVVDLLPVLGLLILAPRGACCVLGVASEFGVARGRSGVFTLLTVIGLNNFLATV